MNKASPVTVFWFIKEDNKYIQCTKTAFDQAIRDGKSIRYNGYPSKKAERIAQQLENVRMAFLGDPTTPTKFRAALTNPTLVIQAEIIEVDDPLFWEKESKLPKYQTNLSE
ncbi:MAG: hypothetical protein NWE92_12120 [Candidatus Bathyarchaeota archaeon]|nr:hypothetical protein [Candidatus Bathyarchaeota archaeon]